MAIVSNVTDRLRLTISFEEPDEEGWIVARVVEVPGAVSQGRSRQEARENVLDALRLMLSPDDGDEREGRGRVPFPGTGKSGPGSFGRSAGSSASRRPD